MINKVKIESIQDLVPFTGQFINVIRTTKDETELSIGYLGKIINPEGHEFYILLLTRPGNWEPSFFEPDESDELDDPEREQDDGFITLHQWIQLQEQAKFNIKIDSDYLHKQTGDLHFSALMPSELKKQLMLFEKKRISFCPNDFFPDHASVCIELQRQLEAIPSDIHSETPANQIKFKTIVSQTLNALKKQSWMKLPFVQELEPWENKGWGSHDYGYILAVDIQPLQLDRDDAGIVSDLFEEAIEAHQDKSITVDTRHFKNRVRLSFITSSPTIVASDPELWITQLENKILTSLSEPDFCFDQLPAEAPSVTSLGLFSQNARIADEMQKICFFDEVVPYAGKIIFYESNSFTPESITHPYFDWFNCGGKPVYPAYIHRNVGGGGSGLSMTLEQLMCQPLKPNHHYNPVFEISLRLEDDGWRFRLPTCQELTILKEECLKQNISLKCCTAERFIQLIEQQIESSLTPSTELKSG